MSKVKYELFLIESFRRAAVEVILVWVGAGPGLAIEDTHVTGLSRRGKEGEPRIARRRPHSATAPSPSATRSFTNPNLDVSAQLVQHRTRSSRPSSPLRAGFRYGTGRKSAQRPRPAASQMERLNVPYCLSSSRYCPCQADFHANRLRTRQGTDEPFRRSPDIQDGCLPQRPTRRFCIAISRVPGVRKSRCARIGDFVLRASLNGSLPSHHFLVKTAQFFLSEDVTLDVLPESRAT